MTWWFWCSIIDIQLDKHVRHDFFAFAQLNWPWVLIPGNSWGIDKDTGIGCLGCGDEQEEFYGCADITIVGQQGNWPNPPPPPQYPPEPPQYPQPTYYPGPTYQPPETVYPTSATDIPISPTWRESPAEGNIVCRSAGLWKGDPDTDVWCEENCKREYCPETHCQCYEVGAPKQATLSSETR